MSRGGWLAAAALCGCSAVVAIALSQAYRGTLVRELRGRHPAEWAAVGSPAVRGAGDELALMRWVRSRRYFELNDADLVSEARNFYYDRLAAYLLGVAALLTLAGAARSRP